MSDSERRKYERIALSIPATVRFPAGSTLKGNTQDISLRGAIVTTADELPLEDDEIAPGDIGFITIQFEFESEMQSIKAPCEVKHLKDNGVGLSIDFVGLTMAEQNLLESLLACDSQSPEPA